MTISLRTFLDFEQCVSLICFLECPRISEGIPDKPNKLFYHKVHDCPDDCSSQGTCDTSTGTCTCNIGYTGANCAGKKKFLEHDFKFSVLTLYNKMKP